MRRARVHIAPRNIVKKKDTKYSRLSKLDVYEKNYVIKIKKIFYPRKVI